MLSYIIESNALIEASKYGHKNIIKSILKNDLNINVVDSSKNTALMILIKKGNIELVDQIIKKGADINLKNKDNETALIQVLDLKKENCYEEIAKLLLNCPEINFEVQSKNGNTAFINAAKNGYLEIINFLLEKKVILV